MAGRAWTLHRNRTLNELERGLPQVVRVVRVAWLYLICFARAYTRDRVAAQVPCRGKHGAFANRKLTRVNFFRAGRHFNDPPPACFPHPAGGKSGTSQSGSSSSLLVGGNSPRISARSCGPNRISKTIP